MAEEPQKYENSTFASRAAAAPESAKQAPAEPEEKQVDSESGGAENKAVAKKSATRKRAAAKKS